MTSRLGVAVMAAALLLYIAVVGWRAVVLLGSGEPIAVAMGVALLVLPLIGAWALVRELQFGFAADRLGRMLDAEGGMPEAPAELMPSGRLKSEDAAVLLARYTAEAEAAPEDWRARYRVGVVQDAAGRRKDARASIRQAIRLAQPRP
ncbi:MULTISPECIES: hypothetical protein [Microbacterium]|uniref:hypothetical protein n=1 Tax=Microbacterium TaxID=33882 RepID=UPI00217DE0CA|nr:MULTISPECIES: hypothetical protein [Microbacterium]UWF78344.1 hypothetical protein JSY13_04875 [Microbacterium neungamense]WCM56521.1 hypothetical protein JRG78_04880 [Microbacterium sp. EF45047]